MAIGNLTHARVLSPTPAPRNSMNKRRQRDRGRSQAENREFGKQQSWQEIKESQRPMISSGLPIPTGESNYLMADLHYKIAIQRFIINWSDVHYMSNNYFYYYYYISCLTSLDRWTNSKENFCITTKASARQLLHCPLLRSNTRAYHYLIKIQ